MNQLQEKAVKARIRMARRFREMTRNQDLFRTDVLPEVKENLKLEFECARLQSEIDLKKGNPAVTLQQARRKAHKSARKDRHIYDNLLAKIDREQKQDPFIRLGKEEEAALDQWYDELVSKACPEIFDPSNTKAIHIWNNLDVAYTKNKIQQAKELAEKLEIHPERAAGEEVLEKLTAQYEKNSTGTLPQWDEQAMEVMETEGGLEAYIQEIREETQNLLKKKEELEAEEKALFQA